METGERDRMGSNERDKKESRVRLQLEDECCLDTGDWMPQTGTVCVSVIEPSTLQDLWVIYRSDDAQAKLLPQWVGLLNHTALPLLAHELLILNRVSLSTCLSLCPLYF